MLQISDNQIYLTIRSEKILKFSSFTKHTHASPASTRREDLRVKTVFTNRFHPQTPLSHIQIPLNYNTLKSIRICHIATWHIKKARPMIENLPTWIEILFIFTCLLTIGLFHYSNGKPRNLTLFIIFWSVIQSILAYLGFYQITDSFPPRFGLVLIPTTLLIIYGLLPKQQKWFFDNRNTTISTVLHSIRLPVEIVLFELFLNKMIP